MLLFNVTRNDWVDACELNPEKVDGFARTFKAKADAMNLWPDAKAWFDNDLEVAAGIIVRISKREPKVANLQLLHTFNSYRRQGLARALVTSEFQRICTKAAYFRVSAEGEALPFYRALGFKFWGKQKSGSSLSMFRIVGTTISEAIYDKSDPVINKALFTKARGGLVEVYKEAI